MIKENSCLVKKVVKLLEDILSVVVALEFKIEFYFAPYFLYAYNLEQKIPPLTTSEQRKKPQWFAGH